MSRVFAAYSVGGLIGPALGAFGGIHGPFLAYLALLLAALPLVLLVASPRDSATFAADGAVLRTRAFWVASAAILFAVLALGVLEGVLPLHFAERLTQAQIGALYVGRLAGRRRERQPRRRPAAAPARVRRRRCSRGRHLARRHRHDVPLWVLALAARRARDRPREHRLARAARRGGARRAHRHRDGRLVADRHHRLPARPAGRRDRRRERRLRIRRNRLGRRRPARHCASTHPALAGVPTLQGPPSGLELGRRP